MAADVDSDVPDTGAVFTFGRSRFADNVAGKFWIKNDPIIQIVCGDEHTAVLTGSGRLFTFGSNEWGQLGHGHTKTVTKPTFVKALKGKRITVVACGRSHTLVATAEGHVYAFGSNSEGQLGSADEQPVHLTPIRVQGLEGVNIKMLVGGADHSMALTDKGVVYVWGSGAEGQIGPETGHIVVPTELSLDFKIMCISAGYYHSAFVTADGRLYMCGEEDSGKLGLPKQALRKKPLSIYCVPGFDKKVVWVSCGGNHTIALTSDGKAYSFGNGYDGQLGLGTKMLDVFTPHQIVFLENLKVARVSCGENHSAFLTDRGQLYTCGNGRHGKLGIFGIDDSSSQFVPTLVARFCGFQVQQVVCGGCHTMILAVRQETVPISYSHISGEETASARERRHHKNALSSSSTSNKNETFSPTLKAEYRQRLSSMTKGATWYVALTESQTIQNDSDEEGEVLTNLEKCNSLKLETEKSERIRHFDSDVESDDSEISDLNRTHTLIRVDNTILITPSFSVNDHGKVTYENQMDHVLDGDNSSTTIEKHSKNLKLNNSTLSSKKSLKLPKSQFYTSENENCKNSSRDATSSKESKSSSACVII